MRIFIFQNFHLALYMINFKLLLSHDLHQGYVLSFIRSRFLFLSFYHRRLKFLEIDLQLLLSRDQNLVQGRSFNILLEPNSDKVSLIKVILKLFNCLRRDLNCSFKFFKQCFIVTFLWCGYKVT
jgi:hypothetical protein